MIKTIAVLGAGTMGHAVAGTFALGGYKVNLFEPYDACRNGVIDVIRDELALMAEMGVIAPEAVESSIGNITLFKELGEAVADRDYVIESIPEDMKLKRDLFVSLVKLCRKDTIIATNTSSLSLGEIIKDFPNVEKKRMLVCHWFNPANLIPLVEISDFGDASPDVVNSVIDLYKSIKKQPIRVCKDVPGLIANRIMQGVARETFSLLQQGVGSAEDIDKAIKFGPAFRYATTGQLEVADFGGLDIWRIVGDNLLKVMDNSQEANALLREKVQAGKLGLKSGEGFFKYEGEQAKKAKDAFLKRLMTQLKASEQYL